MLDKIFSWFEARVETYPDAPPKTPKAGIIPFIFEATKGMRGYLVMLTVLVAAVGIIEAVIQHAQGTGDG